MPSLTSAQFITILKVLLENSQGLAEDMRSIDVPSTLHTLATFIGRVDDSEAQSLRLKLKFCQLCGSVFTKTDPVLKRNKESAVRQSLVDIIVDWVQDNTVVSWSLTLPTRYILTWASGGRTVNDATLRAECRHLQGCGGLV